MRRYYSTALWSFLVITLLVTGATQASLWSSFRLNLALLPATAGLFADQSYLPIAQERLDQPILQGVCRANWHRGVVAKALGKERESGDAWAALIRCSSHFIWLLQIVAPLDHELAELAVEVQPENAEAWFWLADIHFETSQGDPIPLYKHGLQLDPQNGVRWCELGRALAREDPHAAIEAFLQCCHHGDPGANGCWKAGQTAEKLGLIEDAIRYYRLSHWDTPLARANELEAKLAEESNP